MIEKRYFKIEYDEEWYLFDSTTISEQLVKEQAEYGYGVFANSLSPSEIVDLLNKLYEENEQLRMKLKGDDYIMVSEMLSNLRKTGICDGCKNKDKPVEWYLERGFSITGRVCDRYEPE